MMTAHSDQLRVPKVRLGCTDLIVSSLAYGTGTNGWSGRSDQGDLGVERLRDLLHLAYDHGVNFWDTADAYGTHPHVAAALQGIPRDQVVIVSKTLSHKRRQVRRDIDRFLKELNTDYVDLLLLHVMTRADWPKHYAGAMDVMSRAKERGSIRAVGVSCHSLGALDAAAECDWCDVAMVRINYAGVNMDAEPGVVLPILEKMDKSGKGVYGMKVAGNGKLGSDMRGAIRFVFETGHVHAVTIGMMNERQLMEGITLVSEAQGTRRLEDA